MCVRVLSCCNREISRESAARMRCDGRQSVTNDFVIRILEDYEEMCAPSPSTTHPPIKLALPDTTQEIIMAPSLSAIIPAPRTAFSCALLNSSVLRGELVKVDVQQCGHFPCVDLEYSGSTRSCFVEKRKFNLSIYTSRAERKAGSRMSILLVAAIT